MQASAADSPEADRDSPFAPVLLDTLSRGYGRADALADLSAGATVAIVALPLSMAIAIASGLSPDRGLIAAIVGGVLISALGGSRFQIGGPAGAFIVLVASIVERHGESGLFLASMMAGIVMVAAGALRLGSFIRYIPHPVIVGFTAGIAVIIGASQIGEALGLRLAEPEPAAFLPKLQALAGALPTIQPASVAVALATIATIVLIRRWRPAWPGFLIAIAASSVAVAVLGLPVDTVGQRFGALPSGLSAPSMPEVSAARLVELLPDALAIALLGSIESLLSAVVADAMSGTRHRPNTELSAQGVANVGSALFGGMCVTGTIARTATNIRSGARSPVAGIVHALALLGTLMIAAPLAGYIPLPSLAGILLIVAWNMAEKEAFVRLLGHSRGEAAVLVITFVLTVAVGISEGIAAGVVLGSLLFVHRMARLTGLGGDGGAEIAGPAADGEVFVYRPAGPLFFGSASTIAAVMDRIGFRPRRVVIDLSRVPLVDSSAAVSLTVLAGHARAHGAAVQIAGASRSVERMLRHEGLAEPDVAFVPPPAA